VELVALVKHDCPTCDQLLPALTAAAEQGAPLRILSESDERDTSEQAARVGVRPVPELDTDLAVSERLDPDAVPAVILLDGGAEADRVEGLERERLVALFAAAGPELPIVLAAVEAVSREPFALHGLLATTHSSGPVIAVSGPTPRRPRIAGQGRVLLRRASRRWSALRRPRPRPRRLGRR
jgi:hypothetical protein